ncbi:MAG TPA: hypothetical protein VMV18_11755, partial [bacterium]|nr:hypothetical protein [bacterium]
DHPEIAPVFFIPSPELGHVEDVYPERLRATDNEWIAHTREILRKKQVAARGGYKSPTYIGEDHEKVKPATADHCPGMEELNSIGYLLKWPAAAIVRQVAPKGWQLKVSTNYNFYNYSPLTTFPETGEAEAILVETGWTVITPPGWSVLLKNVPNMHASAPGLTLAEGAVRTDMATIPLQTHAFVQPNAPKEIAIKRGAPMAVLFPWKRAATEPVVIDDVETIDEVAKRARAEKEAFSEGGGVYRRLTMGPEPRESELYPKLLARWKSRQ